MSIPLPAGATVRLKSRETAKGKLAATLWNLDAFQGLLTHAGTEPLRVLFGPGSTPFVIAKHFIDHALQFNMRNMHVITDNILVMDYVRKLEPHSVPITIIGGDWDPKNLSLGWQRGMRMRTLAYKPHLTVIGCAGITARGDSITLSAYSEEHRNVLKFMVKVARDGAAALPGLPALAIVTDGRKLGHVTAHVYAKTQDLPPETLFVSEEEGEVLVANGLNEVSTLLKRFSKGDR